MATTDSDGTMRGGVRRPRGPHGTWSYVIDLGPRPAQRCANCGTRVWVARKQLEKCPGCGGEMRDTIERRQQVQGGYRTRAEAVKARAAAMHDLGQGTHVVRDRITLGKWLVDEWLPSLESGKLRATTRQGYRSHVLHHLAPPPLGAMQLQAVTREAIARHYAALRTGGRADGSRDESGAVLPLTASTVRSVHATLHRALRDAVRSHLLPLNPATDIELPSDHRARVLMAWHSTQLSRFLATVEDDRLYTLWLCYATCGARRGELLGLEWPDIDLAAARMTIRRSHVEVGGATVDGPPKTDSGVRTIELDASTVAALRQHRKAQLADRLAAGPRWHETGHVFVDEVGAPLRPGFVSCSFTAAVRAARAAIDAKQRDTLLPTISLHGLRHTHANILLVELRWPATVVSKRLGHASETITLTMYTESSPRYDGEAAAAFASLVLPHQGEG